MTQSIVLLALTARRGELVVSLKRRDHITIQYIAR